MQRDPPKVPASTPTEAQMAASYARVEAMMDEQRKDPTTILGRVAEALSRAKAASDAIAAKKEVKNNVTSAAMALSRAADLARELEQESDKPRSRIAAKINPAAPALVSTSRSARKAKSYGQLTTTVPIKVKSSVQSTFTERRRCAGSHDRMLPTTDGKDSVKNISSRQQKVSHSLTSSANNMPSNSPVETWNLRPLRSCMRKRQGSTEGATNPVSAKKVKVSWGSHEKDTALYKIF